MGKNDFMSPKAIANRVKSKGLQKLRWYCQICQKQCRDENGFKCHCTSEGHLRQMEVFGMNQGRFIQGYSEEFLKGFLQLLSLSHRNSRVSATVVYNEYIGDKNHIHMNATKWTTLTEFIKYLGREGICEIEETPKGWFLTYKPEDKEEKMREEMNRKRERAEKDEEERQQKAIQEQIARATANLPESVKEGVHATKLQRTVVDEPLKLGLEAKRPKLGAGAGFLALSGATKARLDAFHPSAAPEAEQGGALVTSSPGLGGAGSKTSALDDIMRKGKERERQLAMMQQQKAQQQQQQQQQAHAAIPWVCVGIVVKILSKALKDVGLYKKKGIVRKVVDRFVAEVEVKETGDHVRVDQAELETVVPQIGGQVVVVAGEGKGCRGELRSIDTDRCKAHVIVTSGALKGESLELEYEDFSKLSS